MLSVRRSACVGSCERHFQSTKCAVSIAALNTGADQHAQPLDKRGYGRGPFARLRGEGDVDHACHARRQSPWLRVRHLPWTTTGKTPRGGEGRGLAARVVIRLSQTAAYGKLAAPPRARETSFKVGMKEAV